MNDGSVILDGKNITFCATVVGVRDATAEGIANGVEQMPSLTLHQEQVSRARGGREHRDFEHRA